MFLVLRLTKRWIKKKVLVVVEYRKGINHQKEKKEWEKELSLKSKKEREGIKKGKWGRKLERERLQHSNY